MIFDWVIGPVLDLLNSIFAALPTGGFGLGGGVAGEGDWSAGYLASEVSGWLHSASYFFPVQLIVTLLYLTFFALLPAVLVYSVAQWAYRELPDLWGFGPS